MTAPEPSWGRRVAGMSVIAATGVAVIYIPQPIQTLVSAEFGLSGLAGSAATIAVQAGYALGIFFLVSLGDRYSARRQVTTQLVVTAIALLVAAASPVAAVFVFASFLAGGTATVGQLLVSAAIRLAPPAVRARTVAVLLGSFVVGLFVVRTALGAVADAMGWRAAIVGCALLVLALIPLSLRFSPADSPTDPPPYGRILASIPRIAARSGTLRLMTAIHVLCFMAFISLWSMSTVYAIKEQGLTVASAALIGVAGIVGGSITIVTARLHGRVGPRLSLTVCLGAALLGTVMIAAFPGQLVVVLVGLVFLSAGMSSEQVSTQPIGLASVDPSENGRANTIFMAATFIGGTLATAFASWLVLVGGYAAVGVMGVVLVVTAVALAVIADGRGLLPRRAK